MTGDRDDVLLALPRRTIRAEYDRERRIMRSRGRAWGRWPLDALKVERVRRTFVITARPMRGLVAIADQIVALRKHVTPGLEDICALLVGPVAYELPEPILDAIWDAHCEVNRIPKVQPRAEAGRPSATEPSSADSSAGPSTSSEDQSAGDPGTGTSDANGSSI